MLCPQCGTLNENTRKECVRCKTRLRSVAMEGKIPCVNHANREATTACGVCGTRLCDSCAVIVNGIAYDEEHAPEGATGHHDEDYESIPVVEGTVATHASFWSRTTAVIVDGGIILFAALFVAAIIGLFSGQLLFMVRPDSAHQIGFFFFWTLVLLGAPAYFAIWTAMTGQTVGKQVTGIIVLQPDGRVVGLTACITRTLCAVLSALPLGLGFLWVLWDKNGQTWHDKIANTIVFQWSEEL